MAAVTRGVQHQSSGTVNHYLSHGGILKGCFQVVGVMVIF